MTEANEVQTAQVEPEKIDKEKIMKRINWLKTEIQDEPEHADEFAAELNKIADELKAAGIDDKEQYAMFWPERQKRSIFDHPAFKGIKQAFGMK